MSHQGEKCSKTDCKDTAVVVVKVYTDVGASHFSVCHNHMSTASEVILMLAKEKTQTYIMQERIEHE